jgi:hypothetical protein
MHNEFPCKNEPHKDTQNRLDGLNHYSPDIPVRANFDDACILMITFIIIIVITIRIILKIIVINIKIVIIIIFSCVGPGPGRLLFFF